MPKYFYFVATWNWWFRYAFSHAGLKSTTTNLGDGTVIHCWLPKAHTHSKPNLLLIHGLGANAMWHWGDFISSLIPHFNVYVPDLVFFGDSYTTRPDRSRAFQARCLMALMEAQGVVKTTSIAGISYGWFVAYSMVAQFRERVEQVVLCCAGVSMEDKDLEEGMFLVRSLDEALLPRSPEKMRELMHLTFVKPNYKAVPSCFLNNLIQVVDGNKYCKNKKWTQTKVNLEDHIIVPELDPNIEFPDSFVEDYVSNVTRTPLDLSKPLWELHILNIKTSDAEAVGVFRIHHSMGDGASLISLLLACTRKTSDPEALPSVPVKKRAGSTFNSRDGFWWFFLAIWLFLRLIWNTFVDVLLFVATILFLNDTKTPIKGAPGVELNVKKFVHRIVSLDDIKLVKNAMNTTVNDVVVGLTQAGLSRYLNHRYSGEEQKDGRVKESNSNIPKGIRLRTVILVNLRKSAGIQDMADMMAKGSKIRWGNVIGYLFLPFTIALQDDPLDYVRKAKAIIDRKKLSLEPIFTSTCLGLVFRTFGTKVPAAIIRRAFSNITMATSGVIGPQEEISFYGHPIAYLAPTVYGPPISLVVHFQSYVNKMTISLSVDPSVIPDPHELCNDIEESLKLVRDAAINKGLVKLDVV